MATKIRYFYFDLGNVLINFSHQQACQQIGDLVGWPAERVWKLLFESSLQSEYECGRIGIEDVRREFARLSGTKVGLPCFSRALSDIFWTNSPIQPLVFQLSAAGHRMGILSNTCDAHWEFLQGPKFQWLNRCFSHSILSFRVGAAKPGRDIYRLAVEQAQVDPHEIFFTDDRPDNVAGAVACGIDACQFVSVPQLGRELMSRGIRCNF